MHFLKWPLEAESRSESIPIYLYANMTLSMTLD